MESRVMRNRLQVSFWGMHLTAEGIVGIAAALLIVIVVVRHLDFERNHEACWIAQKIFD
jgi:hypothetical protein